MINADVQENHHISQFAFCSNSKSQHDNKPVWSNKNFIEFKTQ